MSSIYDMSGISGMSQQDTSNFSARLARVESDTPYRIKGGGLAPAKYAPVNSSGIINGKIDLGSSNALSFHGIMSPNVIDGLFSVACPSATTATIYWDGTNSSRVILIRRADGTSTTITPTNMGVSGLTASIKYTAFTYWAPFNQCGLGFSPGDTGTPLVAFSASATATTLAQAQSNQSLAGREPIGTFSWTQPAPGGSSGAAPPVDPPPRDPGTCVMINTDIEPLGEIQPHEWRTVHHHQREWIRLETSSGRVLHCTPNHPLYDPEAQRRADWFKSGAWIITNQGEEKLKDVQQFLRDCTKMQVQMARGHLFWANGFLSHNWKLPQQ